jgi:hypothetical protein
MFRYLLVIFIIFFSHSAIARMYQWVDPENGTTQLSGKPPAWYRSKEDGPRVYVFERCKIIDDTSIRVSDEQEKILRLRAFLKVEEDKETARKKIRAAEEMKALMEMKPTAEMESSTLFADEHDLVILEEVKLKNKNEREEAEEKQAIGEELRALIEDWESQRTDEAKELLDKDNLEYKK